VLSGEAQPAGAAEGIEMADLCRYKGLYASSARLFAEALAADEGLAANVRAGHLYRAACSAALAGCGQGEEGAKVDEAGKARLRRQALDWLRTDLAGRAEQLKGGGPPDRKDVQEVLEYWQGDPALAGVRDAAGLPADERAAWQQFWVDVEALRAKARGHRPGST
jgi:hypothetical protein